MGAFFLPIYAAALVVLCFCGMRLAPKLRRRGNRALAAVTACAAVLALATAAALVVTGAISGMWS